MALCHNMQQIDVNSMLLLAISSKTVGVQLKWVATSNLRRGDKFATKFLVSLFWCVNK